MNTLESRVISFLGFIYILLMPWHQGIRLISTNIFVIAWKDIVLLSALIGMLFYFLSRLKSMGWSSLFKMGSRRPDRAKCGTLAGLGSLPSIQRVIPALREGSARGSEKSDRSRPPGASRGR